MCNHNAIIIKYFYVIEISEKILQFELSKLLLYYQIYLNNFCTETDCCTSSDIFRQ